MKISSKAYKCVHCQNVSYIATNHYGEVDHRCEKCSWKSTLCYPWKHECLEKIPEDGWVPPPWNVVTLDLG